MFGSSKKKIHVRFFDGGAEQPFTVTDMPVEQLPQSFEIETIMHIGPDDWLVERAEPSLIAEVIDRGCLDLHLRKVVQMAPNDVSYSQVDITEAFGDQLRLSPDEWVETVPLNSRIDEPESQGLPSKTATADEVYRIAAKLSAIREAFAVEDDGVYCPVCHIANTELGRLGTPCPRCSRELLKFGWT